MRIALVGCGFVADYYLCTLPYYPDLQVVGVTDKINERAERFAAFWKVPVVYATLEDLLADPRVDMVLNLTNPHSHYDVSRVCLSADKHVYSEKPLAMVFEQAEALVQLAKERGLYIAAAPCNLLSESAQTVWKALRENAIGRVRLVYAELDDGLVHRMHYHNWRSVSGIQWPYKDEFEVGCTLEHAGYYLSWLVGFFGPATAVTSFARVLVDDKQTDVPLDMATPDFSVGCITFSGGIVARLTCSIVAPHDHSLVIVGDEGVLTTRDCWDYGAPVFVRRRNHSRLPLVRNRFRVKQYPLVRKPVFRYPVKDSLYMDFSRGVAELAHAIEDQRPSRMSADLALHINEVALAIQYPEIMGCPRTLTTRFDPVDPMPWAS
ncbi:MAG: Gfo/Idh/MocA family oxidoreductase [Chloroflexi bacterium]|nr:Gfo/Idh/MocA family oxidoreductase [Chloroflexota bacterium]